MRIVTDVEGMTVEEILQIIPADQRKFVEQLLLKRRTRTRPQPSKKLIDRSEILSAQRRGRLVDKVALLVDENIYGRSNMCLQFAKLTQKALIHLGLPAESVVGIAKYYDRHGKLLFEWQHAWVQCNQEIVDANVDILAENPFVPKTVATRPYWGPQSEVPRDRVLEPSQSTLSSDKDVEQIWWPDLKNWLEEQNWLN